MPLKRSFQDKEKRDGCLHLAVDVRRSNGRVVGRELRAVLVPVDDARLADA